MFENKKPAPASSPVANQLPSVDTGSQLKGLFPPLVLPLSKSEQIDFDSLGQQIDFLLAAGVDGLWVNGTTGDFFALTDEERLRVVETAVRQVAGRLPVIAQVGDTVTRRAITKAEQALAAGVDFLAVVPPYYLDYTQSELKQHYRAIARAVKQPLVLYQVPQMCKVSLTIPSILELTRDGVLLAIKDSAGDLEFYRRMVNSIREQGLSLRCFIGTGGLMDVSLFVGGHGLMCAIANIVPRLCKNLYRSALAGNWQEVATAQRKVSRLIEASRLPARGNWAATVVVYKWILRELGVIATDNVFEPLQPLTQLEQRLLRDRALPLVREYSTEWIAATRGTRQRGLSGARLKTPFQRRNHSPRLNRKHRIEKLRSP
jgi:4-hydroxy-tetrahydrodipicolinate synthase